MIEAYTYLIGWTKKNTYYYGVRFAKGCDPDELFKTYFTSSKHVKRFVEENGLPDLMQVRRRFTSKDQGRLWETKVLQRMDVVNRSDFLNKTDNISISPDAALRGSKSSKPFKANDPRYEIMRQNGIMSQQNREPDQNAKYLEKARLALEKDRSINPQKYKEKTKRAGKRVSETVKRKIEEGTYSNAGWVTSEQGKRMAEKNNSQADCPHCGKRGQLRAMKRWHFNRCKQKG